MNLEETLFDVTDEGGCVDTESEKNVEQEGIQGWPLNQAFVD